MTDKDILKNFIRENGTINSGKTSLNYMNCHLDYKEYLENRFPKDEWVSYGFVIKRIKDKIYNLPICPICGKIIYDDRKFCSISCWNKDPLHRQHLSESAQRRTPEEKRNSYEKLKETRAKNNPDDPKAGEFGSKAHEKAMIDKYGDAKYNNIEKAKQTLLEKTGYDSNFKNPKWREEVKQTLLEKTGYEHSSKNPENRKRAAETFKNHIENDPVWFEDMKKRSHETALKHNPDDPYNHKKALQTRIERYGTFSPRLFYKLTQKILNDLNINIKIRKEIIFDSLTEELYFIYMKLCGNKINRNKTKFFEYNVNGKIHKYYPDFVVEGNLYVEIKATNAIDKNNNLIQLYKNKQLSDDYLKAKTKCMKRNKIVIIRQDVVEKNIRAMGISTYKIKQIKDLTVIRKNRE